MKDDPCIRAVLFDLDGTLIDTIADIAAAIEPLLAERGFSGHDLTAYKRFVGSGLRNALINALPPGHRLSQDDIDQMYLGLLENYRRAPYGHTKIYDGMEELLDMLGRKQVPTSILSNKIQDLTEIIVSQLLSGYTFTAVQGLSPEYPKKPDPASASAIAARMGVRADQVLLIGDSEVDYLTAQAAGMQVIIVSWGFRTRSQLLAQIPESVIADDPAQLQGRISSMLEPIAVSG